jgi:molybdenum cofactor cytidylyltransferase
MTAGRAGLILAAGASQRMGSPKALLAWGNTTLLEHALKQARAAGVEDLVVVLGPATRHLRLEAVAVFNPDPASGRSASIRLASQALADDVRSVLVQSVDQPVGADVIVALFEAIERGGHVAVPTYEGRRGHPICVSGAVLAELRVVGEEAEGLRSVVRRHAAQLVEVPVDSEAVTWNLNDPAAYAAAAERVVVQP